MAGHIGECWCAAVHMHVVACSVLVPPPSAAKYREGAYVAWVFHLLHGKLFRTRSDPTILDSIVAWCLAASLHMIRNAAWMPSFVACVA